MAGNRSQDAGDSFYKDSFDQPETSNHNNPIDINKLDVPMPWNAASGGARQLFLKRLTLRTKDESLQIEHLLGRKLTDTETDGLLWWGAKETQIQARGVPLGVLGACYRAYATRKEYRFPFLKPSETFNPNVVRLFGTNVAEGYVARVFWQSSRTMLYSLVGSMIGVLLTTSLAISTASTGRMQDPRTKDMFVTLREKARQEFKSRQAMRNSGGLPLDARVASPSTKSQENQSATSNDYNESFEAERSSFDPYSPQSGSEPVSDSASPASYAGTGTDSSRSPLASDERYTRPQQSPAPPAPRYESQPKEDRNSGFLDDTYDDASPTASYPSAASSRSSSGGSSWDRLRTSGSNPNPRSRQSRAAPSTTTGDSQDGSFSRADEESQLAKSQAQKDFDESIERERRGRNFD